MEDETFHRYRSNSSIFSTLMSFSLAGEKNSTPLKSSDSVKDSVTSQEKCTNKLWFDSSLNCESEDDTTRSVTGTDGSSGDEYSLSRNDGTIHLKNLRTLSDGDMILHRDSIIKNAKIVPEWILTAGEYRKYYTALKEIGKGAYGFVRLSHRNEDGLLVVTKFINKAKVHNSSLVTDKKTGKKIPLEIDLLMKLNHPNIVKALDYYENDLYYQLVMEKWGSGMDLFDFIDRHPTIDENLASYIFRQIVSALKYLRSVNVIHRDIKDENIIINQSFHIKLIDFGSAAKLKDGKAFHEFAGTIEYCSPEVLSGKKEYGGPELEVWSLGVTLYTLLHGQNPFGTVKQVISAPLKVIDILSDQLCRLLVGMLEKDMEARMTLDDICDHEWTNLEVDINKYAFENVVPCDNSELSPLVYVTDYTLVEESLSTTSSSFVYEGGQSFKPESAFQKSNSDFDALPVHRDFSSAQKSDDFSASSRTCSSSYKSSVTIDSSVFMASRKRNLKSSTCSSTFSEDITEESDNAHSRLIRSRNSNDFLSSQSRASFGSPGSQTSLNTFSSKSGGNSRSSSHTEMSGDDYVDDDDDEIDGAINNMDGEAETEFVEEEEEPSESSSADTTTSSSSSSTSGSFLTQDTVSIESLSEGTLGNTFSNILALDREDEESEGEN